MFQGLSGNRTLRGCFPRVCGDVPSLLLAWLNMLRFSPRVRGCSAYHRGHPRDQFVFPACAGMFLKTQHLSCPPLGFPRVCGDVPSGSPLLIDRIEFSPRVRGCSAGQGACCVVDRVFPACAGMFLIVPFTACDGGGFPRVCGDVPTW